MDRLFSVPVRTSPRRWHTLCQLFTAPTPCSSRRPTPFGPLARQIGVGFTGACVGAYSVADTARPSFMVTPSDKALGPLPPIPEVPRPAIMSPSASASQSPFNDLDATRPGVWARAFGSLPLVPAIPHAKILARATRFWMGRPSTFSMPAAWYTYPWFAGRCHNWAEVASSGPSRILIRGAPAVRNASRFGRFLRLGRPQPARPC